LTLDTDGSGNGTVDVDLELGAVGEGFPLAMRTLRATLYARIQLEDPMPLRLMIRVTTFVAVLVSVTSAWATVVSDWNAVALTEVRLSKSLRNGPPMVARALAIAHTCMYDAWAAYDEFAVATTDVTGTRRRPPEERTDANKATAISFAAYRCLRNLYPDGQAEDPPGSSSRVRLDAALASDGYDPNDPSNVTPAGIGNIAAQAVIDARRYDGSNQYGDLTPAPCGSVF